ncbi:restriction endonuclease subunit S [Shewanella baltica]|uniref:restriction endonuclease subunit S n=1 Tax=Shewanella baltica TaxID=62322 RepID=UPI0039847EE0
MSDLIPEGWKLLKFGDIANIHKGLTYATSNYSTREYGYPFITLKCIKKNGGFSKVGLKYYDGQYKSQHIVIEGDVVFANTDLTRDGDVVGSPILVPEIKNEKPSLISMDLSKVLPKEGMDKGFIYYWLNSSLVKRYMINFSAGSTVLHLNTDSVPSIPALVPPISEQQKIAAILTSVDEVVEKTQAQIDKLKDLKSGMMQELLTKGVGIKQGDKYEPHTEFKDSPVGRIPKSWEVRKLADLIGSLQGGVSVNGENHLKKHSEIGVLKVSAVFKGRFIPSEYKTITKEDEPRARVNPIKGTILFSRANTPELVGESGYIEESVSDLFLPDKLWMLTANVVVK